MVAICLDDELDMSACRILAAAILMRAVRDLHSSRFAYEASKWLASHDAALYAEVLGRGEDLARLLSGELKSLGRT